MSVKKERKDRKKTGIAAQTCRAIGLAKAEEHKDRKKRARLESAKAGENSNASLEPIIPIARI